MLKRLLIYYYEDRIKIVCFLNTRRQIDKHVVKYTKSRHAFSYKKEIKMCDLIIQEYFYLYIYILINYLLFLYT